MTVNASAYQMSLDFAVINADLGITGTPVAKVVSHATATFKAQ